MTTFTIEGIPDLERALRRSSERAEQAIGLVLRTEAEMILAASQALVPFDEGILSASGHVQGPKRSTEGLMVEVGYGGPAKAYALVQHEDTTLKHAAGRTAKYLERPALARAAGFERSLTAALRAALERGGR